MPVILEDLRQVFTRELDSAFEAISSLSVEELIELLDEAISLLPDLPEGYLIDQDLVLRDEGWKLLGGGRIFLAAHVLESTRYNIAHELNPHMGLNEFKKQALNPHDDGYDFALTTLRDMLSVAVAWLNIFSSDL